jgi:hypothetical protein
MDRRGSCPSVVVSAAVNLQPSRGEVLPFFERLVPAYREYCTTVSKRSMALSIESAAYLWWVCDHVKARSVADLGSGFTSYVVRSYAATADREVTVSSVDDAPYWLRQTADFLTSQNQSTAGLVRHDVWRAQDVKWDVIVHDIGGGELREEWMTVAAKHLAWDGVLIFDDAQNRSHHMEMGRVAREFGLRLFDVYEQTVDEVGRFATVAHR